MDNKLFIPKKIKVGYVHRQDTYTKKLAYVIYYDEKGKLKINHTMDLLSTKMYKEVVIGLVLVEI